jgi:hypothetical protein
MLSLVEPMIKILKSLEQVAASDVQNPDISTYEWLGALAVGKPGNLAAKIPTLPTAPRGDCRQRL